MKRVESLNLRGKANCTFRFIHGFIVIFIVALARVVPLLVQNIVVAVVVGAKKETRRLYQNKMQYNNLNMFE